MIIKKGLLEDIESAKTKLDESKIPNFHYEVFKTLEDSTIRNASIQDGDNAKRKNEVISTFKDAWTYASSRFSGKFDLLFLTEVAGRIEPIYRVPGQTYAEYRDNSANLNGLNHAAPADKTRVMAHLDRMMRASEKMDLHPVEEAIFTYFHLIRIQPFENGNKRTANVVMNSILKVNDFLPISIPENRVEEFNSYLKGAIDGFKKVGADSDNPELDAYTHPEHKQLQLYDFLARKELACLRGAENKMKGLHSYTINLNSRSPAVDYRVKHELSNYFRARDLLSQIRINEAKKELYVIGEIPFDSLERILSGVKGLKNYDIHVNSSGSTQY